MVNRMARRRLVVLSIVTRILVSLAVVAVGFGIFQALFLTRPKPPEPRTDLTLPRVRVMRTAWVSVQRQWTGFGTADAMDRADVPAEVAGIVASIEPGVLEGRTVEAGQPLMRLDDADYRQRLAAIVQRLNELNAELEALDIEEQAWTERLRFAQTDLEVARRDYERIRTLVEQGDAKELELDRVTTALQAAQRVVTSTREELSKVGPRRLRWQAQRDGLLAERALAERNVERCVIRSPLGGVLERVDMKVGEQVQPGRSVARVVNLERIEVPVRLPSSARASIRIGDAASVFSAGSSGRSWSGTVNRVGPTDDPGTRTFPVYIEVLQNPDDSGALAPGKFVMGRITGHEEEQRIVVPRGAVASDRVLLVEDEVIVHREVQVAYQVQRRFPQLGLPNEDYWAVLNDGVEPGSLVVLNGASDIPAGARVEPSIVNGGQGAAALRAIGGAILRVVAPSRTALRAVSLLVTLFVATPDGSALLRRIDDLFSREGRL